MTQTKTRRPRRTYSDEFKNQLVQLYLNGKRKCDIVREYDLSSSLLDKWIKQATSTGSFKEKDNRSEEEQELIQLRKKVKQLEMENDILKQAALILGRR
jgi:transposase